MDKYIYCAVDKNNNIVEVKGSSQKTTYFKTNKYLKGAVERHNELYPKDEWRVARFKLVEEPENVICDYYEAVTQFGAQNHSIAGYKIVVVESGRCRGTKERDICNCKGNKKNCDFYSKEGII